MKALFISSNSLSILMFKINGKDGTLIFIDPRSFMQSKKEIPLWTVQGYKKVKIPKRRKTINWLLGFGYVFLTATILWIVLRINTSTALFLATYLIGAALLVLKRIDDRRLPKTSNDDGIEHVVITTEWGDYIIDCGNECDKLTAFLDSYLSGGKK